MDSDRRASTEISLAILFIVLLLVLVNPFGVTIPFLLKLATVIMIALVVGYHLLLLLNERPLKEVERARSYGSSKLSLIITGFVLILALIYQGILGQVNLWLLLALSALVLTRVIYKAFTAS